MSLHNEAFRRAQPCTLDALHLRSLEILDGTFQFEHVFRVGLATCQNNRSLSVQLFVSSLFVYFDHILWSMDEYAPLRGERWAEVMDTAEEMGGISLKSKGDRC